MNRTTQELRLRHLETLAGTGDAFERDAREVLAIPAFQRRDIYT